MGNQVSDGFQSTTYPNGDVFSGKFLNSKRHGYGEYVATSGARYSGYWKNDQRAGSGTQVYTRRDERGHWIHAGTYKGDWLDNKRHGRGKSVLQHHSVCTHDVCVL